MAAYLKLVRKSDGVVFQGNKLVELDELIAEAMGEKPDPVNWFCGWMDSIGFLLALGKSFADLKQSYKDSPMGLRISEWLEANFDNQSYYGF